ncbi:HK97 family phage prohead protease [Oceanobacillus oncorhynchi]|uniref:HK97 family phage prohead protease n=1 Tax=Oceanobacillus oncorhynchi TaxID=545501 RepID=UPI001868FDA0|nr:HK97 family phage prohead protease [Oceanobacillus oncorhynchi]
MPKELRYSPITETRVQTDNEGVPTKIEGYAAVFGEKSEDLGGFREVIRKGSFAKSIRNNDIRALWNHDSSHVLGRTKNGTLKLEEDETGLRFELEPPDTSWGRDALKAIERGDVDQNSFGFFPVADDWEIEDNENIRYLREIDLFEISPVAFPAYPQTAANVRSLHESVGLDNERLAEIFVRHTHNLPLTEDDQTLIADSIKQLEQLRNKEEPEQDENEFILKMMEADIDEY